MMLLVCILSVLFFFFHLISRRVLGTWTKIPCDYKWLTLDGLMLIVFYDTIEFIILVLWYLFELLILLINAVGEFCLDLTCMGSVFCFCHARSVTIERLHYSTPFLIYLHFSLGTFNSYSQLKYFTGMHLDLPSVQFVFQVWSLVQFDLFEHLLMVQGEKMVHEEQYFFSFSAVLMFCFLLLTS